MMSLKDRVGQMLMGGFDGLTAPDYFLEWLAEGRLGGAILFARNVESPEQVAALTQQLQDAAKYPLLIGIDQEGGTVARLRRGFSQSPGAMALSSITSEAEATAESVAHVLGAEMAAVGINWTYAPVVDITYNADNPTVGTRSYGSDQEQVAALAAASVRGFQSGGVAACAKHFPGLGNTKIDTHLALPSLTTPVQHLLDIDLLPYRVLTNSGLATIMTTHTIFTALDPDHPATLSEHIIPRLLRQELGFDGVVTSDCMEMKAIDDNYTIAETVTRAANAGLDIILFSHTADKQHAAYDGLLAAVQNGEVSEETVNEANRRIEALKACFPLQARDVAKVATPEHESTVNQAARAAVTLVRAKDDVFPLKEADHPRAVMLELPSHRDSLVQDSYADFALQRIVHARMPGLRHVLLEVRPNADEVTTAMGDAEIVILATRSAHLISRQRKVVSQVANSGKHVILLAMRNPYDAGLIEGGTVVCTAGDSYPSLLAIVDALNGDFVPDGRLPVEV